MSSLKEKARGLLRTVNTIIFGLDSSTNIYEQLQRRSREWDLAQAVLEAFIKRNSKCDISMTPAQRVVKDQAVAFCKFILLEFERRHVTVSLFRDGIENLYFLGHAWKNKDDSVSTTIAVDLCDLIDGLSPLMEQAELTCRLATTDWDSVQETIKSELVTHVASAQEELFIPSMGQIQLNRLLGAGGFGAVFKATLGTAVCTVKLVPRTKLPILEYAIVDKEVATMINHPCLVLYHATFATKEAYVTVMEYIRGVDVVRLIHTSTRLTETIMRLILAQLGLALNHLHAKGFIHRDLKPANMMITLGARVKLIDFDTAKLCIGKYTKRALTTYFRRTANEFDDGDIAGTIFYMAPEMLKSKAYGRAIDWYSYGMTGYVMAVGKLPFSTKPSMSFEEEKKMLCKMTHTWPKQVQLSEEFKSLIDKCLYKEASVRFCSKNYTAFVKHPFFSDLDLRWVETSPEVLKFDPIKSVARGVLTYEVDSECESPCATPTAESKYEDLFPAPPITDTSNQVQLFTYLSPGFRKACSKIKKGEVPSNEDLRSVPELVDFDEVEDTFFFCAKSESGGA